MKKSAKSGLIVLILLIIAIVAYTLYSLRGMNSDSKISFSASDTYRVGEDSKDYDAVAAKGYKNDFIAALYIEGTISEANNSYNQKWLLSTIEALKKNEKNAGLALFINSPGGAVYQADEVYLALQDYKTTKRPIYVYQGPMAASGGYYISCAGNKIYANRNTLTGSIGVIMGDSYDLTGLFEKLGIKSTTIHSGENKNMMNFNEPFTEEQQEIMQAICDECYEQFVSIVSNNRGIQFFTCRDLCDGRIYTAKQALDLRLIDAIDSWDNMLRDLAENELNKPGIKVKNYKYQKKQTVYDMITGKVREYENAKAAAQLGVPEAVIETMNSENRFIPMYLAPGY